MTHVSLIRAVLFDLDDTLFDHRRATAEALRRVREAHDCFRTASIQELERHHAELLEELHGEVLAARRTLEDARRERFRRLFARYGVESNDRLAAAAAVQYRSDYLEARQAVQGAEALLKAVRRQAAIGVVSNNLRREQEEKLEHCGLSPYVDVLVVSEEAGVTKPDPAIFALALEALGCRPEETVMLGDSWSADIAGARAAGIRAVWFNPSRLPPPEPSLAVPELHSFEPMSDALEKLLNW